MSIDREAAWRAALARRGRPIRDRYAALKGAIFAAIGELAFNACDLVRRAETDEALAAVLEAHGARNGDSLGRILSGISRHEPGEFCVLYLGRDNRGALWSVVAVTQGDVAAASTTPTALHDGSSAVQMQGMERAISNG